MVKICVPVCVRRVEELSGAVDLAARVGDLVELRMDYFAEPLTALRELPQIIERTKSQLILTMRPAEEGGAGRHTSETRRSFWFGAKDLPKVWFDIELDFLSSSSEVSIDTTRLICSHHDFKSVPD